MSERSLALGLVFVGACTSSREVTHATPAAHHAPATRKGDVITLDPAAETRLGIHTTIVARQSVPLRRTLGGELRAVPGRAAVLTAPVAGTVYPASGVMPQAGAHVRQGEALVRLVPIAPVDRDLHAQAARQLAAAVARLDMAAARSDRARQLVHDRAGSVRAAEEAEADRAIAQADVSAARARVQRLGSAPLASDVAVMLRAPYDGVVRDVMASAGQSVASAATIVEVVATDTLRVRVPVYSGDRATVDASAPARVRTLGARDSDEGREATPLAGPPVADALGATVDLFYDLANTDGAFIPGERVSVALTLRTRGEAWVVPWSSVLHDARGGAWVYISPATHDYTRRRVEVERVAGDLAVLSRGLAPGAVVVDTGAAELMGFESGVGH
jgi:RND family efflux transporter MFP subunit